MLQDMGRITTAVQHCIMAIRAAGLDVETIEIATGGMGGRQTLWFDARAMQGPGLLQPDEDSRLEFLDSLIPEPRLVCVYDDEGNTIGVSVERPAPPAGG